MRRVGVALLLLFGGVNAAEVYKWTGPDGRIHFGDQPPADVRAEEVRIPTFSGPAEVTQDSASTREVVLLTTASCGVCTLAKTYLAAKKIPFTELDVQTSSAGRAEYKRLKGNGVPIILVGGQRMNGFNAARLDQLLQQAGF